MRGPGQVTPSEVEGAPAPASPLPASPSTYVALASVVALLIFVRVASLPESAGLCWDSAHFTDAAEHLDEIAAGTFPSLLGLRGAYVPPIGYPLLLRLVAPLFGSTADGGVFLAIAAAVGACLAVFRLAALAHSSEAGLVAALLVALDPDHVYCESVVGNDAVFGFFVTVGVLALAGSAPPGRSRAALGLALLAVGGSMRFTGVAVFLAAGALTFTRVARGDRAFVVAVTGLLLAAVLVPQSRLQVKGAGAIHWQVNAHMSLAAAGRFPGFGEVDSEGGTLLRGSEPPPAAPMLADNAGFFAEGILRCLLRALLTLFVPLAFAVPAVVAARRERATRSVALLLGVFAVGILFPILTLVNAPSLGRHMVPVTGLLYALAGGGVWRLITFALPKLLGEGAPRAGWRASGAAVVAGLAVAFVSFDRARLPSPLEVSRVGDARSFWARSRAFAEQVKRVVPEGARIGRGPGGLQDLHALFSRHMLFLPTTTPERFGRFLDLNGATHILHGDTPAQVALLERQVAPRRLVPLARLEASPAGHGQMVSRVR